jgi:hypothetical protein
MCFLRKKCISSLQTLLIIHHGADLLLSNNSFIQKVKKKKKVCIYLYSFFFVWAVLGFELRDLSLCTT